MKVKESVEKLEILNKELNELTKQKDTLQDQVWKQKKDLTDFVIKNKLYRPLDTLKEFEGEEVSSITLVEEDGTYEEWSYGEIMEIKDGHFFYSDYNTGILEYSESKDTYLRHLWGSTKEKTFVGYFNLVLGSDWKDSKKEVEESSLSKIINRFPEGELE